MALVAELADPLRVRMCRSRAAATRKTGRCNAALERFENLGGVLSPYPLPPVLKSMRSGASKAKGEEFRSAHGG